MEESAIQENTQSSSGNIPPVQAPSNSPKPNIWNVFSLVVVFLVLSGGLVFAGGINGGGVGRP